MKHKTFESNSSLSDFEQKDSNIKHVCSKFDFELFDEESNTVNKIFRVKRISMPNKDEKWKIFDDSKVIFIIEGIKISKKEKEFLRTLNGIQFLIKKAKIGIKSLNSIRTEMKNLLKK